MGEQLPILPPGEYWFEDLIDGASFFTGRLNVTECHIVGFAGLSGDFFDVHMDDKFARSQGFPARVAHGLLGLALVDGLKNRSSVKIMSVASLGWDWRFCGPIFAGDSISAKVTVAGKRLSSKGKGIATLDLAVVNQREELVQTGSTTLVVRRRNQEAGEPISN